MIVLVAVLVAITGAVVASTDERSGVEVAMSDVQLSEAPVGSHQAQGAQITAQSCWLFPVDRPISDPFRPPECRWCSGNRGVEFAALPGDEVRSVTDGTVWFHGVVGGIGYLTVLVEGRAISLLVTLGGIEVSQRRPRGSSLRAGEPVGLATGSVHLGVRVNSEYVDPALWLFAGTGQVRLAPVGGSPRPTRGRPSCQSENLGENVGARR